MAGTFELRSRWMGVPLDGYPPIPPNRLSGGTIFRRAGLPDQQPVPVMFDFVNPKRSHRHPGGDRWQARGDEPRSRIYARQIFPPHRQLFM
jgi:hypothetical protein